VEKYPLAGLLLIVGVIAGFGAGYALYSGPPATTIMTQIHSRGYIIVGTNTPYPPFEIYNTTTHLYEGFEIELMERVAAYMNVTVQWNDMSFDALVGACKAGTVDMIAAAMFLEPDRAGQLPSTTPYYSMNEVVVVKNSSSLTIGNLTDLNGKIVGVQTGTVEDTELSAINTGGGTIDIRRYARADLLFADLNTGTLDAMYIDEPVYVVYGTVYNLKTIFTTEAPPIVAYLRPDGLDLLGEVNLALYALEANGTIAAMVIHYFG
jgi:polar amino acid transport system substrate-binding protein